VLIADYWLIRRTDLRLADLYRPRGAYWYGGGWNWRAVVAFGAGALLAVGGAWSAPGGGPFPADGLIPALKPLYNYNWVVGFSVALVLYWALTAVSRPAEAEPAGNLVNQRRVGVVGLVGGSVCR
jgi:NCS1 family nucleobase:cation symporter-1